MAETEIILLFSKVIFSTIAAFLGIFFLAYTRNIAWMAMILGVVIHFVAVMYETFLFFGIISPSALLYNDFPISTLVLEGLPSLCFGIGFIVLLLRSRKKR